MPFKSKSQQRFMFARHPKMAREFSEDMDEDDFEKLPEKKKKASIAKRRAKAVKR